LHHSFPNFAPKTPVSGREWAFSSLTCKILKLAYYRNYGNDFTQILHNDNCHVLAALSCYRLSHRDGTFVNWIAEQHLHDRCGLRDRTCVALVVSLSGPRGDRPVNRGSHQVMTSTACPAVSVQYNAGRWRGQINVLTGAV